jgi:DNA-binding NarL/FixJ family response regulator
VCKLKVVIVDDQEIMVIQVKEILEDYFSDLEIHTLTNPFTALGFILEHKPEIVILDRIMEKSGNELLTMIKKDYIPHSIMMSSAPVRYELFDYTINKSKLKEILPEVITKIRNGENKGHLENSYAYQFIINELDFNSVDRKRLDLILTEMEENPHATFSEMIIAVAITLGVSKRSVQRYVKQMQASSSIKGPKKKPKDFIDDIYTEYQRCKRSLVHKRKHREGKKDQYFRPNSN